MVPTPTVIDQDKYNTLQAMDKQTFDEDESKSMHNVTTIYRVIQYNTICNREPHTMQVFNTIHAIENHIQCKSSIKYTI